MSPVPSFELHGITKRFGAVTALDNASLQVRPGEIVAVAGENGSGKSTMMRVAAGVHRADEGRIVVGGAAHSWTSPRDALGAGIAMVSQDTTGVPQMTVADNVLLHRFGSAYRYVRRAAINAEATEHLRRVGLNVDPSVPFGSLSAGDQSLVEIAKALATEPSVLILDEVTTRMPNPEGLFGVLDQLVAERNMAVLLVTHRLREIRRLAHRAVVLRDGVVVGELSRDSLSDEQISSMMVGRELVDFFDKPPVSIGEPVLVVDRVITSRSPHPISFTVGAGEIVGVAGLMGSGRSELLESIAGARRRLGGSINVAGRAVISPTPSATRKARLGFVPEDRHAQGLLMGHSVTANVALASHRTFRRTSRRAEVAAALRAIERLGIRCTGPDAPVAHLSGGNQQKVVLARALDGEPQVLLLDEPTRGVDVGAKAEIYRIVSDLVAAGMGLVIASSDLLELLGLCDRIVVLHEGAVAGTLGRGEATEDKIALLSAGGSLT